MLHKYKPPKNNNENKSLTRKSRGKKGEKEEDEAEENKNLDIKDKIITLKKDAKDKKRTNHKIKIDARDGQIRA